jgi:cell division protein FtsI/penicillin-binding protein 2
VLVSRRQDRPRRVRRAAIRSLPARALVALTALAVAVGLAGCGGGTPRPQTTLGAFLSAWSRGDWAAMRTQVADPPSDFTALNAQVFSALGVRHATFQAGAVQITRATATTAPTATARVFATYALARVGAWRPTSTVHLVKRRGAGKVAWTPATIDPGLEAGERIEVSRVWAARGRILGAGGTSLTRSAAQVIIGVEGSRIRNAATVRADLLAARAPSAAVTQALAQAKRSPADFEPVFTVSQARFAKLRVAAGADNLYRVPGTVFQASSQSSAITPQLGAHVVGSIGPITAQELKTLGFPYDASSVVGQSGLEQSEQRTLAGTPSTHIDVDDADGDPLTRLATYPGRAGQNVRTSLDPRVQRAAEAALATATHKDVSMVAMRATTGQVLAIVSDPVTTYDTALQGAYPPGSSFKILTSTALFEKGLTPASPASCPTTINVDGETFHNAEGDSPVSTVTQAFTESCNTAFIGLATHHLDPADFSAVAGRYGLERSAQMGLPAFMANVPTPSSETELAGDSIGQGDVTFSALGMADVAASVDSGVVRAPRLVAGAGDDRLPGRALPTGILSGLRAMMADVVASGTAAGFGLPGATHAKTGTAEYGTGPATSLKIDGWLVGYDRGIAFAIVTHDTGGADGGPVNAPIIATFLNALGSKA